MRLVALSEPFVDDCLLSVAEVIVIECIDFFTRLHKPMITGTMCNHVSFASENVYHWYNDCLFMMSDTVCCMVIHLVLKSTYYYDYCFEMSFICAAFISNLPCEDKGKALLQLLPLLQTGNDKAKNAYLKLISDILVHSKKSGGNLEESRQLLSYLLIHPAMTSVERSQLYTWMEYLGESQSAHNHCIDGLGPTSNGRYSRYSVFANPSLPTQFQDRLGNECNITASRHSGSAAASSACMTFSHQPVRMAYVGDCVSRDLMSNGHRKLNVLHSYPLLPDNEAGVSCVMLHPSLSAPPPHHHITAISVDQPPPPILPGEHYFSFFHSLYSPVIMCAGMYVQLSSVSYSRMSGMLMLTNEPHVCSGSAVLLYIVWSCFYVCWSNITYMWSDGFVSNSNVGGLFSCCRLSVLLFRCRIKIVIIIKRENVYHAFVELVEKNRDDCMCQWCRTSRKWRQRNAGTWFGFNECKWNQTSGIISIFESVYIYQHILQLPVWENSYHRQCHFTDLSCRQILWYRTCHHVIPVVVVPRMFYQIHMTWC